MEMTPVEPGAAGRGDPVVASDDQQIMDPGIDCSERCRQGGARLPLMVDPPRPVDQLREPTLEPARPPRVLSSADSLEDTVLAGVLQLNKGELARCEAANRDIATETAEQRLFNRQKVRCAQSTIGEPERCSQMPGLPHVWQDVLGFTERRSRLQELAKAVKLGAERPQIARIRDKHLGWMSDRSRSSRSGIAPEIGQLVGANHIEHPNAILRVSKEYS